jgi:putative modified peptide
MTDSTLTKEQAVALLRKLGSDDSFRELFQAKPAKAMLEIGIPSDQIVDLSPLCLCPVKLTSKDEFQRIADTLDAEVVNSAMTMVIPRMKI